MVDYVKMDAIISLEVQLEEEVQTYREQVLWARCVFNIDGPVGI